MAISRTSGRARALAAALGAAALVTATSSCTRFGPTANGGTASGPGISVPGGGPGGAPTGGATPGCAAAEVIAARGTGEPRGMSLMGGLNSGIARQTGGVVYNVNYPASIDYLNGPQQGAADTIRRLNQRHAQCPNMKFVLTGYSEGAMVMTVAFGRIPAAVAPNVVGGVLWGNPYYKSSSPAAAGPARSNGMIPMMGLPAQWAPKIKDYCNVGDPICGAGANIMAHLTYQAGASQTQGTAWGVSKVRGG